ncbi:hypothetical protein ACCS91_27205 [Rhizobium ruizarguesonis]
MQMDHNADGGLGASLSRRNLLQIAAAGTAAAFPAVAEAATGGQLDHQLPLTDEQLGEILEACIDRIKRLLALMHADCSTVRSHHIMKAAGSMVMIVAERSVFDGEGLYEVDGVGACWITRFWSEQDRRHDLWGARIWDGRRTAPREIIAPAAILRKIEGGAI